MPIDSFLELHDELFSPCRMAKQKPPAPAAEEPKLSVIVPCYNEEENLAELFKRLKAACQKSAGDSYEILFVDDGSTDESWSLLAKQANEDPHCVAIALSRNYGHQLALSAGLALARGARVLLIDADLQDPPELLDEMMKIMDDGADVVYGKRLERAGETFFKRASAAFFYRLLRKMGAVEIPTDTGDFRLLSRRAVGILNRMPERSRFLRGMVSWIGLKQKPLPYERAERFAGVTHYSLGKMFSLAMDALSGFSIVPLRLASYMGFAVGIAALALILYALGAWLVGATTPGWTSLSVIILVLGSAQLMSLGVFGEYLGRLYLESKQRPLFIIDKIVKVAKEDR
jgi:dolichol-phosphate mannosyltransferase